MGIDPGTARVGFGVIEKKGSAYLPIYFGITETLSNLSDRERLEIIFDKTTAMILKYKPDLLSIEQLFYFKNAKTIITVAQARGVILLACQKSGIPLFEPTPLQVKQGITGYGRAEKSQIANMVKMLLKLESIPKPDDITDALAIAITGSNYFPVQNQYQANLTR
jgi:crossover junction endodeoxyribonuclease RuvC